MSQYQYGQEGPPGPHPFAPPHANGQWNPSVDPAGGFPQFGPIEPLEAILGRTLAPLLEDARRTTQAVEALTGVIDKLEDRVESIERAVRELPGEDADDEKEPGEHNASTRPKKRARTKSSVKQSNKPPAPPKAMLGCMQVSYLMSFA